MIIIEHKTEMLSMAFLKAIAARAEVVLSICDHDFGVDGTFTPIIELNGFKTLSKYSLDFQLKSTTNWKIVNNEIVFDLDAKNYNYMANNNNQERAPLILLIFCLPQDKNVWLNENEYMLVMKKCCYWSYTNGSESSNVNSVRIKIPTCNIFDSETLTDLLEKVKIGSALDEKNDKALEFEEKNKKEIDFFALEKSYENAIECFFGLKEDVSDIVKKQKSLNIKNENDLLEYIFCIIQDIIAHHVENRRLIDPFWNGKRKKKIDGRDIEIPAEPKSEKEIQKLLDLFFHMLLDDLGIHMDREPDEGIGKIDFKFMYTTQIERKGISISVEFKLAHHQKIKEGITEQLTSYLKANKSTSGIFVVMWFKDEKGALFNKPTNLTKVEMINYMNEIADEIHKSKGLNIKTVMIDASIKKSASKL